MRPKLRPELSIGCDDVPRDSALRQVIERRDLPCEGEWMTLQHRARVREPEMLCRMGHP